MKWKLLFFLLPVMSFAVSCKTDMDVTELTDWEFEYNDQWYSAKVPGCIHTDLMAHNAKDKLQCRREVRPVHGA